MACCGEPKTDKTSRMIEKELAEESKRMRQELKLLLLGAGESGKSTIAKQFKILTEGDMTAEELEKYRPIVYSNTFHSIKTLVMAAERLGVTLSEESRLLGEDLKGVDESPAEAAEFLQKNTERIKRFWADKSTQEIYGRSKEFQLNDNAKYCLENIDRFTGQDYQPTQQDGLHCRQRTTGVIETIFQLSGRKTTLIDVGGQRSERRKWMNCFDNVTAVLFCVGLSEYDLKLAEDEGINRMHESLKIFEETTNKWFAKGTTIILFLNKCDLFQEKISKSPLSICFPDYEGANEFEEAATYIRDQFALLDPAQPRRIIAHLSCATDSTAFAVVYEAVKATLINQVLTRIGLL